jgi:glycosyltransferase involved in cell wall biosynthesis
MLQLRTKGEGQGGQRSLVVHVTTRFIGSGAERSIADIIAACTAPEFEHVLIVGRDHQPESIRTLCGEIQVIALRNLIRQPNPMRDMLAFRDLVRTFRHLRPDIVHTIESKAGILARAAGRFIRVPIIVHSSVIANVGREIYPIMSPIYLMLERLAARWTDQYLVNGLEVRERNLRAGIGEKNRYEVIRSSVDSNLFREASENRVAARQGLGLPLGVPIVLFAGHLDQRKGAAQLPLFFEALRTDTPDALLVIAGEGPLRKQIESEFRNLRLADAVVFLGFTPRLPDAMAAADCLVMLSRAEGMATILVHAAASGTPFVSYAVDGPGELIGLGAKGVVTRIGDWRGAAALTAQMLRTPPYAPMALEEWAPSEVRRRYRRVFNRLATELVGS